MLTTRVGRALWGDNLFCGHSIAQELAGTTPWWSLISLACGHVRLGPAQCGILDDLATCTAASDPRIWPLKLIRLGSAGGSLAHGLCAGFLGLDGMSGPGRAETCARWLHELVGTFGDSPCRANLDSWLQARLADGRPLDGFGVAARRQDERVAALLGCPRIQAHQPRRFFSLVLAIDALMRDQDGPRLNIAGATTALLCDLGFTPARIPAMCVAILLAPLLANAREGAEQAPEVLRQLPDDAARYLGPAPRLSPRAEAAWTMAAAADPGTDEQ